MMAKFFYVPHYNMKTSTAVLMQLADIVTGSYKIPSV